MKILTKEEEEAHYDATVKGGIAGGLIGLGIGFAAAYGAHHRFPTFRDLTLPMKAFLVTSSATFTSIIAADRASRRFERARDPQWKYYEKALSDAEAVRAQESTFQRLKDWGRENRYPIVGASWVASMIIALALVGRNPYLTTPQKLVQARVYAQGLTVAVLIATAAFELGDANKGKGRWETVMVLDPNDPEHKHMIEKRIHHEAYAGEDLWKGM
jgi:Hypoxia induced protein conserved region